MSWRYRSQQPTVMPWSPKFAHSYRLEIPGWVQHIYWSSVPKHNPNESSILTLFTVWVLQAETGFVTFCHPGTVGVQQVVVGEDVHAVIMAAKCGEGLIWPVQTRPALLDQHPVFSTGSINKTILTRGRRARPTSGAPPSAWSPSGRCCGSGRRSGAAVDVRRASWPWLRIWTGSPPQQRSTACAEVDPRCKPSAAPEGRSGSGQRPLGKDGEAVSQAWLLRPRLCSSVTHSQSRWLLLQTWTHSSDSWQFCDAGTGSETSRCPCTSRRSSPSLSRCCCPSTRFP